MAKDKTEEEILAKKEKKEKKEKKRKREQEDAVAEEVEVTAVKPKKEKKRKSTTDATTAVLNKIETNEPGSVAVDADGDVIVDATAGAIMKMEDEDEEKVKNAVVKVEIPLAAFVPFANPLCDDKSQKKVLKSVKKAAKSKAIKRGVKECVKAIRKSPLANPTILASSSAPHGIVVLAADISPMDVISHIPVLCEDHAIPYVYVPSRAELGAAGATKRPTSVVMITPQAREEQEEWGETYKDLMKVAVRLGQTVRV